MKASLKKKIAKIREEQRRTGGGSPSGDKLSDDDIKLSNIIKVVNVCGLDVNESKVLNQTVRISTFYISIYNLSPILKKTFLQTFTQKSFTQFFFKKL